MWVFTTIGFFSAVKVRDDHAEKLGLPEGVRHVMVRARVRNDLVMLGSFWAGLAGNPAVQSVFPKEPPEILEWKGRDYPYRMIMTRTQWAILMERLADGIDYPNFKGEVTKTQGQERHNLYGKIWSVMYDAERWLDLETMKIEEQRRRYRDNPPLPFDDDDPGPDDSFGFSFGSSDHLDSIIESAKRGSRRGGRRRGKGKKKKR